MSNGKATIFNVPFFYPAGQYGRLKTSLAFFENSTGSVIVTPNMNGKTLVLLKLISPKLKFMLSVDIPIGRY